MKRKQIVDFFVATLLIIMGAIILIFPLMKMTNVKYILITIFSIYGFINLLQFILTFKDRDYEGLFTFFASIFALILSIFMEIEYNPLNLAITLFAWISLMSLIKLKKCDYYHDRHRNIWILKIITLILFVLIGLLTVINLYYTSSVQVLIIGFFLFIHGVLELVDPVTNYLVDIK